MNEHHDNELPDAWIDALKRADDRADGPTPATDAAVLAYARAKSPRAVRRAKRRLPAQWAAAAVIAALVIGRMLLSEPTPTKDFNADGRVDVLDAYALARGLQRGEAPAGGDVDGDGAIDQGDVDAMLRRLVRLEGGTS